MRLLISTLLLIWVTLLCWPEEILDPGPYAIQRPLAVRVWAPRFRKLSDNDSIQAAIDLAHASHRATGSNWTVLLQPRVYVGIRELYLRSGVNFKTHNTEP